MQHKDAANEEDSLFPDHIIQDLHSPHYSYHQHKTSPSPRHHLDDPLHHQDQPLGASSINSNQLKFYQEFKKIYTVSHHLALQKTAQMTIIESLNKRIKGLEDKLREGREKEPAKNDQVSDQQKAKRPRRSAEEIEKKFKCEVQFCEKFYGSEGSLQQHIKLKHPELYQKSHSEDSHQQNLDSFL